MNTPIDPQVVLLGVLAVGLLWLLITLLRKAGQFGSLLLACGGSVVVLLLGAHFLGSGSTRTKVDFGRKRGEPTAQVWVDMHTSIYHCLGTELYGRTSGGRHMIQRNAQEDLFSPAHNRPCP
jgi:hypothetical protein